MSQTLQCPTCGGDRFTGARQIQLTKTVDGTTIRSWHSSLEDASHIECQLCDTVLIWDSKSESYQVAPKATPAKG